MSSLRWLSLLGRQFLLLPLLLHHSRSDALRHMPPRLQLPQQPALPHAHSHPGQAFRLPLLQPPLQSVIHAPKPRPTAHRRAALQVSRLPERVLTAGRPKGAPEECPTQTGGERRRRAAPSFPSSPTDYGDAPPAPDAPGAPHSHHGAMMTEPLRDTDTGQRCTLGYSR